MNVCVCVDTRARTCSALNEVEKLWSHAFQCSVSALTHRYHAFLDKLSCFEISSSHKEPVLSL